MRAKRNRVKWRRYLVTGGTGFLGSALVRWPVFENARIRILDNDMRGAARRLSDVSGRIDLIRADIRDPAAVRRASKGMDAVVHFAYLNGTEFFYTRPDLVLDIGVKSMVNVLDACIDEGIHCWRTKCGCRRRWC